MDKPHISISQVNKYNTCGMQYKFHYIDKIKIPYSARMLRGNCVDSSANLHFAKKLEDGKGITKDKFIDNAVNYHNDKSMWSHVDTVYTYDDLSETESMDATSGLAETYYEGFGGFEPISVQQKIEVPYDSQLNFLAFTDLVIKNQEKGTPILIDNKVRAKDRYNEDLTRDIQLVKYADLLGYSEVGLAVTSYNNGKPKVILKLADITKKDKDMVNKRIDKTVEGIRKEVFNPVPTGNWVCTPKWCGFYEMCEFGKG